MVFALEPCFKSHGTIKPRPFCIEIYSICVYASTCTSVHFNRNVDADKRVWVEVAFNNSYFNANGEGGCDFSKSVTFSINYISLTADSFSK